MNQMNVLTKAGDVVVEWQPDDEASVAKAKAEWDRLKKDGYEFFEPVESKGKRLSKFDAKRGRVIAAPGVQTAADKKAGKRGKAMAGGPNDRLLAA